MLTWTNCATRPPIRLDHLSPSLDPQCSQCSQNAAPVINSRNRPSHPGATEQRSRWAVVLCSAQIFSQP